MTRAEFDAQMRLLLGLKFPPPTMDTHWVALQDRTLDAVREAVRTAAKQCSEFPSPAELLALAPRDVWSCPHVAHCNGQGQCRSLLLVDPHGARYTQKRMAS